jgi:hypothetical protein
MTTRSSVSARKHYWPLAVGLLATALAVGWTVLASVRQSGGHFVYGLDDAYIHMTIARTFAQHGVWGISPDHFVSASSSPMWVLILAALDRVVGVHEITSFILNLILAALLLWQVFNLAVRARMNASWTCALVVSVGILTPLTVLVMNGMEHVLQTIVDLAFVASAITVLTGSESRHSRTVVWMLAAIVTAVRYEGAVLVGLVACLFMLRGRWYDALAVAGLGALPIVALGSVSLWNGGFFLPNSILIKTHYYSEVVAPSNRPFFNRVTRVPRMLFDAPNLLALVGASVFFLVQALRSGQRWTPAVLWNGIFVVALVVHLQLAAVGGYRYEAYLIVLGLVAIALTTVSIQSGASLALVAVLLLPLMVRAYYATISTPTAVANIYEQQYQMGLLIRSYYPGATVAVNDIGAASFLGERSRILDLVGLADQETARAALTDTIGARFFEQRTRKENVEFAILYEDWFEKMLPPDWRKVAQWTIPNRVAAAFDTVTFYAANDACKARLVSNLRAFSGALPAEVKERSVD